MTENFVLKIQVATYIIVTHSRLFFFKNGLHEVVLKHRITMVHIIALFQVKQGFVAVCHWRFSSETQGLCLELQVHVV